MKKNYTFIISLLSTLLLFLTTNVAVAQSVSKQINEIKRNEVYLFDEATAASAEEAREAALVKLAKVIADYMSEKNPEGAKNLDDFKDLAEGAEEIVTDRGSQKRVFLYFKKSDIDATAADAAQNNEVAKSVSQPKEELSVPVTVRRQIEPPVESTAKPVAKSVSNVELAQPIKQVSATQSKSLDEETFGLPSSISSINDNNLVEWQKRLVEKFTGVKTLLQAKDLANTFRIENKIKRYGTQNTQQKNPAESFYIIGDLNGKVVAVLGRDNNGLRINYKTNTVDNINNYYNLDYIWFTLNK